MLGQCNSQFSHVSSFINQEHQARDQAWGNFRTLALEEFGGVKGIFNTLNGNICRIAVQPPRMANPEQVEENRIANGANGDVGDAHSAAVFTNRQGPANLHKNLRTIGDVWQEWWPAWHWRQQAGSVI